MSAASVGPGKIRGKNVRSPRRRRHHLKVLLVLPAFPRSEESEIAFCRNGQKTGPLQLNSKRETWPEAAAG